MRVISGIEVTTVSETAQFPVGGVFSVAQPGTDLPPSVWRYVKCVTTALAAYDVASYLLTGTTAGGKAHVLKSLAAAGSVASLAGIAQHAIALNSYGFIQIGGIGQCRVKGTPAIGLNLIDADVTGQLMSSNDRNEASAGMTYVLGVDGELVTMLITLVNH